MTMQPTEHTNSVLFIPHGGGPLPLLGDKSHRHLVNFLQNFAAKHPQPSAIVVISAHWEEDIVNITSGTNPALIYDYSGFPAAAYQIEYPAPGNPHLAEEIRQVLECSGIPARLNPGRGFDHGLFVPLKLMYPQANIPCLQISLVRPLQPKLHLRIGKALAGLNKENLLILGSGFSFHNLNAFFSAENTENDAKNQAFEDWLIDTCTNPELTEPQRETRLVNWQAAPFAGFCHPRAEHLLPLHVCAGLGGKAAQLVFADKVLGKQSCGFLW